MKPSLVIYFAEPVHRIMSDEPILLFEIDPEKDVLEIRPKVKTPKIEGYSLGGACFPALVVEKFDSENNALYLRPGWELKIHHKNIDIEYFDGGLKIFLSDRIIKVIRIVYARR